jgi:hypothetical protein
MAEGGGGEESVEAHGTAAHSGPPHNNPLSLYYRGGQPHSIVAPKVEGAVKRGAAGTAGYCCHCPIYSKSPKPNNPMGSRRAAKYCRICTGFEVIAGGNYKGCKVAWICKSPNCILFHERVVRPGTPWLQRRLVSTAEGYESPTPEATL